MHEVLVCVACMTDTSLGYAACFASQPRSNPFKKGNERDSDFTVPAQKMHILIHLKYILK